MPNENDTEASRKDALNTYESLFGDAESSADDTVAKEQDAKSETDRKEQQGSEVAEEQAGVDQGRADESDQDPRESDIGLRSKPTKTRLTERTLSRPKS